MEARWRRPRWRKDPLWVLLAWMLKIYCYLCFLFKNLQREINALKVEISAMKKTASEKRKQLLKETETHTQIKKDTEVRKASNLHPTPEQLIIIFPKCVQNYARLGAKTLFGHVFSDPAQTLWGHRQAPAPPAEQGSGCTQVQTKNCQPITAHHLFTEITMLNANNDKSLLWASLASMSNSPEQKGERLRE